MDGKNNKNMIDTAIKIEYTIAYDANEIEILNSDLQSKSRFYELNKVARIKKRSWMIKYNMIHYIVSYRLVKRRFVVI